MIAARGKLPYPFSLFIRASVIAPGLLLTIRGMRIYKEKIGVGYMGVFSLDVLRESDVPICQFGGFFTC